MKIQAGSHRSTRPYSLLSRIAFGFIAFPTLAQINSCPIITVPSSNCQSDFQCDDHDSCTIDTCAGGTCVHNEVGSLDCCAGDGDCDDMDSETIDSCRNGSCIHIRDPQPICGDDSCDAMAGESSANCFQDCSCGDHICDSSETLVSCYIDCGPKCGDAYCDASGGEDFTHCPGDCATCGNGICEVEKGETVSFCAQDCPYCGNHVCELNKRERAVCPPETHPCFVCLEDCDQCVECPPQKSSPTFLPPGVELIDVWTGFDRTHPLTYFLDVEAFTNREILASIYADAAKAWSEVLPFEIVAATNLDMSNIRVEFCRPDGHSQACDDLLVSGVVYQGIGERPFQDKPVRQVIRLPDDMSEMSDQNILYALILHEFGHNLGLADHSLEPDAVMFRSFRLEIIQNDRIQLHADDIERVQGLYGNPALTLKPELPDFGPIPEDPGTFTPPTPEGLDSDGDGYSDVFERDVTRTNPFDSDSDSDGLSDSFELSYGLDPNSYDTDGDGRPDGDEVIAGRSVRAPRICDASPLATQESVGVTAEILSDWGLKVGDLANLRNIRTGCRVDALPLVILSTHADELCDLVMPADAREKLCVYRPNSVVPIRFCSMKVNACSIYDFETPLDNPIAVNGSAQRADSVDGGRVLRFEWSLSPLADPNFTYSFAALTFDGIAVGPCDRVRCAITVEQAQKVRLELKSRECQDCSLVTRDAVTKDLLPGSAEVVQLFVSERYPWAEFAIVIEPAENIGLSSGTVTVDNIELLTDGDCSALPENPNPVPIPTPLPQPVRTVVFWSDTTGQILAKPANQSQNCPILKWTDGLQYPEGLAIDEVGHKIYWTDINKDSVERANFDGTIHEEFETEFAAPTPTGLAVDPLNGEVWWAGPGRQELLRKSLTTNTDAERITTGGIPQAVALDPANRMVYWTDSDFSSKGVYRRGYDGVPGKTKVWPIASGQCPGETPHSESCNPAGIALGVANNRLYWGDDCGHIHSADLDGCNEFQLKKDQGQVQAVALDLINQKIYWSNLSSNKIKVGPLVGLDKQDFVSTSADSYGIAIIETNADVCARGLGP